MTPATGLRIFVLEDHEDTRLVLKSYLERLGHQVWTASSMREATLEFRKTDFDFLLCDIGLSDGLGWNFMESLHFAKPVFAVAMSGVGEPEDLERSRRAGFRFHLVKPLDFAMLNELLKAVATDRLPKFAGKARIE